MIDIKSVAQLADLMEEKGLSCLEVCEGEHKICLTKAGFSQPQVSILPAPVPQAISAEAAAAPAAAPAAAATATGEELSSPIVGIGYLCPAPGADPFVQVGSKVKKGQTLCIIEAMKVMNEFTAPKDGEITEVSFSDGQLIEFGQCLFRLA